MEPRKGIQTLAPIGFHFHLDSGNRGLVTGEELGWFVHQKWNYWNVEKDAPSKHHKTTCHFPIFKAANVSFYDKMWTDTIIVLWNLFQQSLWGMYTVPICKAMFQAFSPTCD